VKWCNAERIDDQADRMAEGDIHQGLADLGHRRGQFASHNVLGPSGYGVPVLQVDGKVDVLCWNRGRELVDAGVGVKLLVFRDQDVDPIGLAADMAVDPG